MLNLDIDEIGSFLLRDLATADTHQRSGLIDYAIALVGPAFLVVPALIIAAIGPCFNYTTVLYPSSYVLFYLAVGIAFIHNLVLLYTRQWCTIEMRRLHNAHVTILFAALGCMHVLFAMYAKTFEIWWAFGGIVFFIMSVSQYFPSFHNQHSIRHCYLKGQCNDDGNFIVCPKESKCKNCSLRGLFTFFMLTYVLSQIVYIVFIMVYIDELQSEAVTDTKHPREGSSPETDYDCAPADSF